MAKTPIDGSDYTVRVVDFPDATVGGSVVEDADGFHNIYINARRSAEAQRDSFFHELRHIAHNDFHNELPISEIEESASQSDDETLIYNTVEEYAQFVEAEWGIRLNLDSDATLKEVSETVAFLRSLRNRGGMCD